MKWKSILRLSRALLQTGAVKSGLFADLASWSGSTPLKVAAQRGDTEVVEIMLEHGADPSMKNDLGCDVFSYCEAFPGILEIVST